MFKVIVYTPNEYLKVEEPIKMSESSAGLYRVGSICFTDYVELNKVFVREGSYYVVCRDIEHGLRTMYSYLIDDIIRAKKTYNLALDNAEGFKRLKGMISC